MAKTNLKNTVKGNKRVLKHDKRFKVPTREINLTDQAAIELMTLYDIDQKVVAEKLGIGANSFHTTYHRMKSGSYTSRSRGAVDRAKLAILEIVKEKEGQENGQ